MHRRNQRKPFPVFALLAYALSKTANRADAEDVTHDTFVQIWKTATQYSPMGKPLAWIFTIEMNLIRRQFHKNQKFIPLDESVEVETDESFQTEAPWVDHNSKERRILRRSLLNLLRHSMDLFVW